ncbi:M28 family metallopeptidase [Abyssisolibacter fermentans]|uniref:M28 family metallopeptidase n=1 Tax=Abyssisolibacter fermentans TaxID=1766203 RepID=UPI0008333FDD|nr:M28 family metallopeptidase [Abyssisolibacter fermentans]
MNKNKFNISITAVIIIILLMFIFVSNGSNSDVKKINEYLTSDECNGRLTGTLGNENAQAFIESYFKNLKLESLITISYLHPYQHKFHDFNNSEIELNIKTSDGKVKKFKYGIDFMPNYFTEKLDITHKISKTPKQDCFLLLDDRKSLKPEYCYNTRGIFYRKDSFMKNIRISDKAPIIQISENLYDYINTNDNCEISLKFNLPAKNITANNVIAKISGENNKNAIILSAHFDHVGKSGKDIYRGALDNSSGMSVLLNLAQKLKEYSSENTLDQDIIFCSFNGEESGRHGSKAFVKQLLKSNTYENIYNINFDCIGTSDKVIMSSQNKDSELVTDITACLENKNYTCSVSQFESDQDSFSSNSICAIGISTEFPSGILHTKRDTIDKLNIDSIENFSEHIFTFITKNSNKTYAFDNTISCKVDETIEDTKIDRDFIDKKFELGKDLNINQYKFVMLDNDKLPTEITRDEITYNNISDFKEVFTSSTIPNKIDNYIFDSITLSCHDFPESIQGKVDKIYTFEDFSTANIHNFELTYKNDTEGKFLKLDITKLYPEDKVESVEDYCQPHDKEALIKMLKTKYKDKKIDIPENYFEKVESSVSKYSIVYHKANGKKHIVETAGILSTDVDNYIIIVDRYRKGTRVINGIEKEVQYTDWFDNSFDETKEFIEKVNIKKIFDNLFS